MSGIINEVLAAIEAQQPKERSTVWMAGEQLKDMIRQDEAAAQIVLADLRGNAQMTLAAAEKKIAERARKNRGCVCPAEAEEIQLHGYGNERHGANKQHHHRIPQEVRDFCDRWEREVLTPWFAERRREDAMKKAAGKRRTA